MALRDTVRSVTVAPPETTEQIIVAGASAVAFLVTGAILARTVVFTPDGMEDPGYYTTTFFVGLAWLGSAVTVGRLCFDWGVSE